MLFSLKQLRLRDPPKIERRLNFDFDDFDDDDDDDGGGGGGGGGGAGGGAEREELVVDGEQVKNTQRSLPLRVYA